MPKGSKLKGKMSSYAYFVQTCREEQKKKHPDETVVFSEFSKKCSEKWKAMTSKEKKRFEDMASKSDAGGKGKGKRKRTKDPNAPKRSLSGFFFFCNEERSKVRAKFPDYMVGDVAKELGKRWEVCQNRSKFESMAVVDKARYEKEMKAYREAEGKQPVAPKKSKRKEKEVEEEEEEDKKEGDGDEDEEGDDDMDGDDE